MRTLSKATVVKQKDLNDIVVISLFRTLNFFHVFEYIGISSRLDRTDILFPCVQFCQLTFMCVFLNILISVISSWATALYDDYLGLDVNILSVKFQLRSKSKLQFLTKPY